MIRSKFYAAALIALFMLLTACSGQNMDSNPELTQIRLPMGFIPNVQYAPFYVAAERGYFEDEGLSVDFDYSLETDGVALVGSNELSFSLASGEQVLLARGQGAPVVYVMTWWQDFPVAVTSLAEQEVDNPQDLAGLNVGIPGRFGASYIGYIALMRAAGVAPEAAKLEAIGFNQVEALVTNQQDAVVVYANNEPIQLAAQGYEIDVLRVSDYVELASNGLITNQQTIDEEPELVEAMVRAILRGIQDTLADPEAAFDISINYVEGLAEAEREVQMQVLQTSIDYWKSDQLGHTDETAWQNMQEVLLAMDLLGSEVAVDQAYTNDFIPR